MVARAATWGGLTAASLRVFHAWLDLRGRCTRREVNRPLPPSGSTAKIPTAAAVAEGGRGLGGSGGVGGGVVMQSDGEGRRGGAALVGRGGGGRLAS